MTWIVLLMTGVVQLGWLMSMPVSVENVAIPTEFVIQVTDANRAELATVTGLAQWREICRAAFDEKHAAGGYEDTTPLGFCTLETGECLRITLLTCLHDTNGMWRQNWWESPATGGGVCCCDGVCTIQLSYTLCDAACIDTPVYFATPYTEPSCTVNDLVCGQVTERSICNVMHCEEGTPCVDCMYNPPLCPNDGINYRINTICAEDCYGACCKFGTGCIYTNWCNCTGIADHWYGPHVLPTICFSAEPEKLCCFIDPASPNQCHVCMPLTECECETVGGAWGNDVCTYGSCQWTELDPEGNCTVAYCTPSVTFSTCMTLSASACRVPPCGAWQPCLPCPN